MLSMIPFLAAVTMASVKARELAKVQHVLARLERLEEKGALAYRADFTGLSDQDAPALLQCLPTVRHPGVVGCICYWMAEHQVSSAIPAMIKTLDRVYEPCIDTLIYPAAYPALTQFGTRANGPLIWAIKHGGQEGRSWSAEILVQVNRESFTDKKIQRFFVSLSKDRDPGMRCSGGNGCWSLAFRPHMLGKGDLYDYDVNDLNLLRPVLDLACDEDKSVRIDEAQSLRDLLQTVDRSIGGDWYNNEEAFASWLEDVQPKILAQVKSKKPEMRAAAIMLENYRGGLDQVRYDALSDPDPVVVHSAVVSSKVKVMSEWIPKLTDLSSSAKPNERRVAAILLRSSQDPTALPALQRLAKDPDPGVRAAAG